MRGKEVDEIFFFFSSFYILGYEYNWNFFGGERSNTIFFFSNHFLLSFSLSNQECNSISSDGGGGGGAGGGGGGGGGKTILSHTFFLFSSFSLFYRFIISKYINTI